MSTYLKSWHIWDEDIASEFRYPSIIIPLEVLVRCIRRENVNQSWSGRCLRVALSIRCKLAFSLLWSDSHRRRLLRSDNNGVLTDAAWFVSFRVLVIARKAEAVTSRLNTKHNTQRLRGIPQERRKDKQREHVDYPFIPLSLSLPPSLSDTLLIRHVFSPSVMFTTYAHIQRVFVQ